MNRLLLTFVEMRQRLLPRLRRIFQTRTTSVLSSKKGLFSEELWLTTSVLFLPVLYMTAALALLSDTGLGRRVFLAGLLLWGGAVVLLHRDERWQRLAATLLLFLIGFALVAWITSHTLDMYWDSREYHALSIRALLDGSNPYLHKAPWYYTYPAASWLLSSSLIVWTQSFETTFAFKFVALVAAFLCVRRFLLLLEISRAWRFCLSALFVANPFTIEFVFSFLNDTIMASVLLGAFALMLCVVLEEGSQQQDKRRRLRTVFGIGALLVLLVNIKFTGLVYGGVLGLTALAYGIWRSASRRRLVQLAGLGAASFVLGVFVFGFYPYVTNTMQHQNPFHPATLFDKQANAKASVIFEKYDPAFTDLSQPEQWWIFLFGVKKFRELDIFPKPLPPFTLPETDSVRWKYKGFFSGAFLLSLTLVFFIRHRGAWIVMAGVMASVFFAGIGFSFRHAPQNWWLPMLLLVFVLARKRGQAFLPKKPRIMTVAVTASMAFLSIMTMFVFLLTHATTVNTVRELEQQGGWYVVPAPELSETPRVQKAFFDYYKSGLTNVDLPTLSECPDKAEQHRIFHELMLCRP